MIGMTEQPPSGSGKTGSAKARPFLPRKMDLTSLIRTLVDEHAVMKDGLRKAREAAHKGDFETLLGILRDLDSLFRQHIVDEESTILRLLVSKLGVEGAKDEIRVFQQHRPIYQLMKRVSEFASMPATALSANQRELAEFFDRHATAEERLVFPRAESL